MTQYLIRRLVAVVPTLLGVSIIVFSFIHLIPGDPALAILGERATDESIAQVRTALGLDKPLWQQYLIYIGNVLRGDLGRSILRAEPVTEQLLHRFPATVELSLAAMLVAVIVGLPAGIVSAVRHNSLVDVGSMLVSLMGVSMPIFWLGLMASYLFGVVLRWLPTGGRLDPASVFQAQTNFVLLDTLMTGNQSAFVDAVRHLILPAVVLGTIPMAIIARMTRSAMLEVLGLDYIRTARAKGLSNFNVVLNHALRNALLPVVTIVGLQIGTLLGGAILTETIFSWPGIGRWVYEAIQARDYPIVQGVTLFLAFIFVMINLLVDLSYALLDPRIRLQ
jgi:peptide/nickel transport system permease protein